MKTRFTSLDVACMVTEMQVYDFNAKTLLLKFAKQDSKVLVLVESGIRVHPTVYAREKSQTPSNFNAKLRKHLKSKRLKKVTQLGVDRIVDFVFGEDEFACHLFVELYSSGNIILTSHDHTILAVLRVVNVETNAISNTTKDPTAPPLPSDEPSTPPNIDSKTPVDPAKNASESVEINFRVAQRYTMVDFIRPFSGATRESILDALIDYKTSLTAPDEPLPEPAPLDPKPVHKSLKSIKTQKKKGKKSAQSSAKDMNVRKWCKEKFGFLYGPALVEHALAFVSSDPLLAATPVVNPTLKMSDIVADADLWESVLAGLTVGFADANAIMEHGFSGRLSPGGWITRIEHKTPTLPTTSLTTPSTDTPLITYDEFHPYPFAHLPTISPTPLHFPTFSETCDEFFTKTESHRLSLRLHSLETTAQKKLTAISSSHQAQVSKLHTATTASQKNAQCIEMNLEIVDAVIQTVRQLVASGMDWVELWELVKEEKRQGNHVAGVIEGLKLEQGVVTVGLMDPDFEEEESSDEESSESESEDDAVTKAARGKRRGEKAKSVKEAEERRRKAVCKIDLDIYESAWANARRYYDSKKLAAVKAEKTITAVSKALQIAEKKITQDLVANQTAAPTIRAIRTPYWFEKFNWFVSSENYLIVSGRDALQTDLLLHKHMRSQDVLVSSDMDQSPSVLILNTFLHPSQYPPPPHLTAASPIPPLTLHQAGTMAVSHSRAWEAKIVTSAWWVLGSVVMRAGGVDPIPRAEKNYLPPVQLVYGLGLLFSVEETEYAGRDRVGERRPWMRGGGVLDWEEGVGGGEKVVVDKYELGKPGVVERVEVEEASLQVEDVEDAPTHDAPIEDVEEPTSNASVEPATVTSTSKDAATPGKKRISAKERRELKKKAPPSSSTSTHPPTIELTPAEIDSNNESSDSSNESPESTPIPNPIHSKQHTPSISSKNSATASSAAALRGKKAKLKKMKSKYADQSDEEREVMMSLLHGPESTKKKKGKSTADTPKGNPTPPSTSKSKKPTAIKHKPSPAASTTLFTGDSIPPEDLNLSILDSLTSQPHPSDTLASVVPVCAPWSSLSKYKYKVKLVPGSLKRGKAAKQVEHILHGMSDTPRESEMIAAIPEAEMVAAILGKVKVMGASGAGASSSGKKK
ncbi:hypothetical protein HDU98_006200 [Podochytrium sp. JEL0797]|nr:hypothetical protein HDU98_006200 [Podochytrium sp. JEL0797]